MAVEILIGVPQDPVEGEAVIFPFLREGRTEGGFALFAAGQWHAYRNRCRHMPVPLDYGDGIFWDSFSKRIACTLHGAHYRPEDGVCDDGPCIGRELEAFPLRQGDGVLWVTLAPGDAAVG